MTADGFDAAVEPVLDKGVPIAVPRAVLTDVRVSREARLFYCALAASIGSGRPRPVPIGKLAERIGVSPRTGGRWAQELSVAGHVRQQHRPGRSTVVELLSGGGPEDDLNSCTEVAA